MNPIKWLRWNFGRKIKLMNNQGECFYVPAVASIEDLARLGFSRPSIKPHGTPLKPGEWEAQNMRKNRVIVRDTFYSHNAEASEPGAEDPDAALLESLTYWPSPEQNNEKESQ